MGLERLRVMAAALIPELMQQKHTPPVSITDKLTSGMKAWGDGLTLCEKGVENVNRSAKVVTSVVAGGVAVKAALTGLTEPEANAGGMGLRLGEQVSSGEIMMTATAFITGMLQEKQREALVLLIKEQQKARLVEAARFALVKYQDLVRKKSVGAQEPRRDAERKGQGKGAHPRFERTTATAFLSFD